MEQFQKPKINQLVGVGNGKREPTPIGLYQGIYWSEKYQNRDHALVRIPRYVKVIEREKFSRIERLLPHVTSSMILIPVKYLKVCQDVKYNSGNR